MIDLDEISKKFDEILASPETEIYFKKLELREKMGRRQIKRFHEKYDQKTPTIQKIKQECKPQHKLSYFVKRRFH